MKLHLAQKIGLVGMLFVSIIAFMFYVGDFFSPFIFTFFIPFSVLILIGYSIKSTKKRKTN